jgi:nucleoside-diphosphate-sugar epimerase
MKNDSIEHSQPWLAVARSRQSVQELPPSIRDVEHLEELLSEPNSGAVEAMARLQGDLVILGVGGKMGPTLARMARRASEAAGVQRRIIGVSRFSSGGLEKQLQSFGIETIRCDLLERQQVEKLPDVPNVIFMTGMKFGSTGQEAMTWAMNVFVPGMVCQKYCQSRMVAFSTGNVYGLTPVALGGNVETDVVNPLGDYAMSCLGRERILEHFSRVHHIPIAVLRLNYATEMRYGVLVDLARKVWAGQTVDLAMGHLNAIWQADANAMTLQAFDQLASPPRLLNIAGPELLSVRRVAERLGQLMGKPVTFTGSETPDALLSNAQLSHRLFGYPRLGALQMIEWIADWVQRGGANLGKPTHFEVRDGKF